MTVPPPGPPPGAAPDQPVARRLVLLRHAKSDHPLGVVDRDRPLAERGLRDATAAGTWLAAAGLLPDLVLVSPARRARETWELAGEELAGSPVPHYDDRLYSGGVDSALEVLREADDAAVVVAVGHNPTMEQLARALDDGKGFVGDRERMASGVPTSGTVVLDVRGPWADLAGGACRLAALAVPRG